MTVDSFRDFWALVVDVWNTGVFGVDIGRIIIAIGIFWLFVLVRRLFSRFVIARLKGLTAKSWSKLDDRILSALEKPLAFVPIVAGLFFATEYLDPEDWLAIFAVNLNRSLIAFTIFWGLYNTVGPVSYALDRFRGVVSESMIDWFVKALRVVVIVLGAATILEIWGIAVGPIIAGLGLFGVAVALGAQDLFKNLIAGLFVISERRFQPGDWILVEGVAEGTIEAIGFRTTRIRRFDMAPLFVPNSNLADNVVTNFSKMTYRRIFWTIGVEYRTSIDQLRKIRDEIEAYVVASDEIAQPPQASLFVRIDKFSEHSIDIMLYCFTKTTVWGEWLVVKEKLAYEIKRIIESNGAALALPAQSLYVETLPPVEGLQDRPERFPLLETEDR